ncbi:MATE family efflux transporter [Sneathiella chinensis]|uniref:Cation efflux system protein n=1 Tax=Sneathiella chinensis TaxID=349750 RepID=A0ABQ5U2Z2_9PROT|nr:MATE family efflux transporter [Sneathiella chinensis]GLQ06540.1 cation efflux system protein [Sneathiella chinensis]
MVHTPSSPSQPASPPAPRSDRLSALLSGPIAWPLLKMAAPNTLGFLASSVVAMAEMWYAGQLGTATLASFAFAFPMAMLMQMLSSGSIGGVVAASVARSLGANDRDRALQIVWHAIGFACLASAFFTAVFLIFGEVIFTAFGASGDNLKETMDYISVLFSGILLVWLFNTLSSLLRGAGDMRSPAVGMILMATLQTFAGGALSLGWFGIPSLGIRGIAFGTLIAFGFGCVFLGVRLLSGKSGITLSRHHMGWSRPLAVSIARVAAVAALNPFLTVSSILLIARIVSNYGETAIAGFGIGARLEFILIPIVFGIGAAMISFVGANMGAGQVRRAERVGWTGGLIAAAICGTIGVTVALWPQSWAGLFTTDPDVFRFTAEYQAVVGPAYAFFGLGLSLYFASQGAHTVIWPVVAGLARLFIAAGIGTYLAEYRGAEFQHILYLVALGLAVFGLGTALSLYLGAWRRSNQLPTPPNQPALQQKSG